MPLNIPAGDGLASYHLRVGTDPEDMILTLGVRPVAGPFDAQHLLRLETAFRTTMLAQLPASMLLSKTVVRVRQDGGDDTLFERAPSAIAGGVGTGAVAPPNVAYLFRKITTRGGRRGRGRWFVPGVQEAHVDADGLLTSGIVATYNTAAAAYLTALAAAAGAGEKPVIPILLHNNSSSTARSTSPGSVTVTVTQGAAGPLPDVITSMTLDARVATQRRRLRP